MAKAPRLRASGICRICGKQFVAQPKKIAKKTAKKRS